MHTNKNFLAMAIATASLVATFAFGAPEGYESRGGFWLGGKLNISPFLELGYLNDDNPNSLREITKKHIAERKFNLHAGNLPNDEKYVDIDSNLLTFKVGTELLLPANHWKLSGRAFYLSDAYLEDDFDDRTDWYESLILSGETEGETKWSISEVYQDIRYDDAFELTQEDRIELAVIARAEKALTDKSSLSIGAFFRDRDYEDDELYDYLSYGANFAFAHALTEKTAWTFSLGYTLYDKDEYDSDAYAVNALLGIRTLTTEKLTFNVAAGAEYFKDFEYTFIDAEEVEHSLNAEDEIGFTYSLTAKWKASRRLTITLDGHSEFQPAEDVRDNSVYASTLSVLAEYRPGDNWRIRAGLEYRRDDYNRDIDEGLVEKGVVRVAENDGHNRTDDEIAAFARVAYRLTKYCSIYADWRRTDISSSIPGFDYERQRYGAGVALKY